MIKDLAKHVRAKTQKINKRSLNLNGGRERSGPAQHAARAVRAWRMHVASVRGAQGVGSRSDGAGSSCTSRFCTLAGALTFASELGLRRGWVRWKALVKGYNFGVGLEGYGDKNLGGFWWWPPASFGAVER
jgi:hypothetical protein